ncbi:MAG: hypothetical protein K1X66_05530 [Verrucomicrobiae bacterium]|nr:hypothetical protein [Verrucomicrobiae bacterium]
MAMAKYGESSQVSEAESKAKLDALLAGAFCSDQSGSTLQFLDVNHDPIDQINITNPFPIFDKNRDGRISQKELNNPNLDINTFNAHSGFYIQYKNPDLVGKGEIQVDLQTYNPTNSNSKNSETNKVTLYEVKPGVFVSNYKVLFSTPNHDQRLTKNHLDNSPNDQSYLGELGSQISVSYQNEKTGKITTANASVPIKNQSRIQPVVFRKENGEPTATQAEIDRQMEITQAIYASQGIKLIIAPTVILDKQPPVSTPPGKKFANREQVDLTAVWVNEEINKQSSYTNDQEIRVVFWGSENYLYGKNASGTALTPTESHNFNIWEARNAILLADLSSHQRPILAHEIGHLYLDNQSVKRHRFFDPIHARDTNNLMNHKVPDFEAAFTHYRDQTNMSHSSLLAPQPSQVISSIPRITCP